jgi:hypothetical protein
MVKSIVYLFFWKHPKIMFYHILEQGSSSLLILDLSFAFAELLQAIGIKIRR